MTPIRYDALPYPGAAELAHWVETGVLTTARARAVGPLLVMGDDIHANREFLDRHGVLLVANVWTEIGRALAESLRMLPGPVESIQTYDLAVPRSAFHGFWQELGRELREVAAHIKAAHFTRKRVRDPYSITAPLSTAKIYRRMSELVGLPMETADVPELAQIHEKLVEAAITSRTRFLRHCRGISTIEDLWDQLEPLGIEVHDSFRRTPLYETYRAKRISGHLEGTVKLAS